MATNVNPSTGAATTRGSKPSAPPPPQGGTTAQEDEIRAALVRWDELSLEEKRLLTKAIRSLPAERFKVLETEFGLSKKGSGLQFSTSGGPHFAPKEDLLVPKGLLDEKKAAQKLPEGPEREQAEAGIQAKVSTTRVPKWLPLSLAKDDAAVMELAQIYGQLTGRDMPRDPAAAREALFRDPAFSGAAPGSPAASVAATMALNMGFKRGGEGGTTEVRYRNGSGQERVARLNADHVALAADLAPGFLPHIQKVAIAAEESGVPWQLIFGVVRAMTGWDPGKTGAPEGTTAAAETNFQSESDSAAGIAARPDTSVRVKEVTELLDAYYEELGDWGLAVMAIQDAEAARTLKATGRVGNAKAYDFVRRAVFGDSPDKSQSLVELGWDTKGMDLVAYDAAGKMVGASGKPLQLPDRESMAQQVRGYFRNLLLRDPTQQEIDGFVTIIESQIIGAQTAEEQGAGNPYNPDAPQGPRQTIRTPDPEATLQASIEGTQEFKDLYKNKPTWMSPDQYVGQVSQQANQVLGAAPDDEALRVGLKTGAGDAYTGYLQGRAAGKNTVSFRERLYAASQILNGL